MLVAALVGIVLFPLVILLLADNDVKTAETSPENQLMLGSDLRSMIDQFTFLLGVMCDFGNKYHYYVNVNIPYEGEFEIKISEIDPKTPHYPDGSVILQHVTKGALAVLPLKYKDLKKENMLDIIYASLKYHASKNGLVKQAMHQSRLDVDSVYSSVQ